MKTKRQSIDEFCDQPDGSFAKFVKTYPDPDQFLQDAKDYPNIIKLKIKIYSRPTPHIKHADLAEGLKNGGLDRQVFSNYFGVQTCSEHGLYPHDVEAVLERMINKRLTGTQLFWD